MNTITEAERQRQINLTIQGRGMVAARRARLAKSSGKGSRR